MFRRWARAGPWQQLHDALRDLVRVYEGRDPQPTAAVIDSASVRGADTVPAASRGYDGEKKINGRKRHIAVDTGGLLLGGGRYRVRDNALRSHVPHQSATDARRTGSEVGRRAESARTVAGWRQSC